MADVTVVRGVCFVRLDVACHGFFGALSPAYAEVGLFELELLHGGVGEPECTVNRAPRRCHIHLGTRRLLLEPDAPCLMLLDLVVFLGGVKPQMIYVVLRQVLQFVHLWVTAQRRLLDDRRLLPLHRRIRKQLVLLLSSTLQSHRWSFFREGSANHSGPPDLQIQVLQVVLSRHLGGDLLVSRGLAVSVALDGNKLNTIDLLGLHVLPWEPSGGLSGLFICIASVRICILTFVQTIFQMSTQYSDPLPFTLLLFFLHLADFLGRAQLLLSVDTIRLGFLPPNDLIKVTHGGVGLVPQRPVKVLVLFHFLAGL